MRRLSAWLLTASLLLSNTSILHVTAADLEDTGQSDVLAIQEVSEQANESQNAGIIWEYAPDHATGGLELTISNSLPLKRSLDITVKVINTNQKLVDEKKITVKSTDESELVVFEKLQSGTYTIVVSAPGFADYRQEIVVNGTVESAEIYTSLLNLGEEQKTDSYQKGKAHPGVYLIGDVDGDGKLTEADKEAIMDAAAGIGNTENADLNGDGIVDITDLQYFTNSWKQMNQIDTQATFCSRVSPEAVKVQTSENTKTEGDLQTLLSGNGGVSLTLQNGREISAENPIEVGFALQSKAQESAGEYTEVEEIGITTGTNGIQSGAVILETSEGEQTFEIENGTVKNPSSRTAAESEIGTQSSETTLKIDLGGKVAVKRVTIRITGAKGNSNLVEISKVEFLNHTENRIPEPDMDIPKNLSYVGEDGSFTLNWEESKNVTAYEVEISSSDKTEVVRTAATTWKVTSFNGKELVSRQKYKVRVQAVNGTWKSGYSDAIQAMTKLETRPDAPDYVKAVGAYKRINVSWKQMDATDGYYVYYREKGTKDYIKSAQLTEMSYEISGLKDKTSYEIYVTGVNEIGESAPSLIAEAATTSVTPAKLPLYKVINESKGTGVLTTHIVSAKQPRGNMVNSTLDSADSAFGVVDDDYNSYFQIADWDEGAYYPEEGKGIHITFDQKYKMNYITFAEAEDLGSYGKASVYYYDEEQKETIAAVVSGIVQKTDANGRKYYAIKLAEPIETNRIRVGVARTGNYRNIVIAEMKFYYYDSLEDDVNALYADDLHTQLKSDVTLKKIEELQKRLDTVDEQSGEYHPEREAIQKVLDNAKGILETPLGEKINISSKITAAKDKHLGFDGLNAWQPLGVSAYAGEQIVVYVGHNSLKTGANTSLRLIATQYHSESSNVSQTIANLKVGRNEVTIPKLQSLAAESGGSLYVEYTGNNEKDQYAVRVSGGVKIPVLNLYGVESEAERTSKITTYISELEAHVNNLENHHNNHHKTAVEGTGAKYDYDEKNCIAGATDIVLDQMMYSVSAKQILNAVSPKATSDSAKILNQSLKAMDDMMELFYQHKGLTAQDETSEKNRMPSQHLNIRYMRMFAGAFMYAAGNHIGIEWDSVGSLVTSEPLQSQNGKYVSGNLFGWGIAHEIGHNINQNAYEVAEITNNYFAQLTTARDTNESVRFKYEDVYEKVTSNTIGRSDNVATQLAMYWQLHLAYDRGYNFKTYETYEEQFNKLFYARVDTYARDTSCAPQPKDIELTLGKDTDQNFMRLASAAAEKDLSEFFVRWGMMPNEETLAYVQQFEKEDRAIYYTNDDNRVYEIENGVSGKLSGMDAVASSSTAVASKNGSNEVELTIQANSSVDTKVVAGYEIARYTYEGGKASRQVVGFAPVSDESGVVKWLDHVSGLNNRVITYEVKAVDRFGYYSLEKEIGKVRISHDGSLDKTMWSVTTNMISEDDAAMDATEKDPCEPTKKPAITRVIDNDYNDNTYVGKAEKEDAFITIDLKQSQAVCGLKYKVTDGEVIRKFTIEVSEDGKQWTKVREDSFEDKTGSHTMYFQNEKEDPWVATYDASYVRLTVKDSKGKNVAITELDILGPSGDSICLGESEENQHNFVGILSKAYEYESGKTIPKGSLVFVGGYKGNPAYNVVLLYDEDGNIIGGQAEDGSINAEQIILAEVPEDGLLGEVSDGTWIYWIEPDKEGNLPTVTGKIRAELYRVDNAMTNNGQRLVSDTLPMEVPDTLGNIELGTE